MALTFIGSERDEVQTQDRKRDGEGIMHALKDALEGRSRSIVLHLKQDWNLTMRHVHRETDTAGTSTDEQLIPSHQKPEESTSNSQVVCAKEEIVETENIREAIERRKFFNDIRNATNIFKFMLFIKRLHRLERRFLTACDRVVAVSDASDQEFAIWLRHNFEQAIENQDEPSARDLLRALRRLEKKWWPK